MLQKALIGVMLLLGALGVFIISPPGQDLITEKLTVRDGSSGYLYGYPLVTMVTAEELLTAAPAAGDTLVHLGYPAEEPGPWPPAGFLVSYAWLDLSGGEAFLVTVPDMGERYWLMPVLDGWTDVVASPGTRTNGNGPGRFLITGPGYEGPVPAGAEPIGSDTGLVWLQVLIATADAADAADASDLRDAVQLLPVTARGEVGQAVEPISPESPPVSLADVRAAVDGLSAEEFFDVLAAAMVTNPPRPEDADAVAGLEQLGLTPGAPFSAEDLSSGERSGLDKLPEQTQQGMTEAAARGERDRVSNGWRIPPMVLGDYGGAYGFRATTARDWLGALLPADLVRATADSDADGQPLDGSRAYEIAFPVEVPAAGPWSVGIENGRSAADGSSTAWVAGPGAPGQQSDGTVRVVVSQEDPGPDTAWLRPPEGPFALTMQLRWPDDAVLSGQWEFPAVAPLD